MFFRLFFLFAVLAVAFANPKPDPQLLTYNAPVAYTGYNTAPLAYAAGYAPGYFPGYAQYPYGYSAAYYVRK